ncbi:hypothetical protein PBCV1_a347L [Paramecium bursaria Chlorella virus 1]|uniref:Uncharacterized protein n=1 Tax=Paramecium bursaria Chlorella virus 1 TaxID=10506 RepID=Q84661_PBCV1|nr:hypothetical protein PBCV1_a347L [Paramecium bursaria Chlorella virus 1]AAC96715.1 hypothetical protein [Paramecium bursaria Chlorella virus 1]
MRVRHIVFLGFWVYKTGQHLDERLDVQLFPRFEDARSEDVARCHLVFFPDEFNAIHLVRVDGHRGKRHCD